MKACKGGPSTRSVSCIYNRGLIHIPSYVAAKKKEYSLKRRRQQNRDAISDYVQQIIITVTATLSEDVTHIIATVPDPKKFCNYFNLTYDEREWMGNIFFASKAPKPETIQERSDIPLTIRKAHSIYHRSLQNSITKLLRTIRYLQCPKKQPNQPLKKPSFKIIFKSDIPWLTQTIFNHSHLRSLPLRKLHQKHSINKDSSFTQQILEFHNLAAAVGLNRSRQVDLWKGSSRYAPDKHAIGLGKAIRSILHKFNVRYEASTQKCLDLLVPPEFHPTKKSFIIFQLRALATSTLPAYKRKALLYYRKYTRRKKALSKRHVSSKQIATQVFLEAQASLNQKQQERWPKWLNTLSAYFVNLVGDLPGFHEESFPPPLIQHPICKDTFSGLKLDSVESPVAPLAPNSRLVPPSPEDPGTRLTAHRKRMNVSHLTRYPGDILVARAISKSIRALRPFKDAPHKVAH